MSHYLNHPEFYGNPVLLTDTERQDPNGVLRDFFEDYNLAELRQINQDIKEVCLTTDRPPFSESENRADHLLYQDKLMRVLEAAFVIAKCG